LFHLVATAIHQSIKISRDHLGQARSSTPPQQEDQHNHRSHPAPKQAGHRSRKYCRAAVLKAIRPGVSHLGVNSGCHQTKRSHRNYNCNDHTAKTPVRLHRNT
jgi:hypothetical protein